LRPDFTESIRWRGRNAAEINFFHAGGVSGAENRTDIIETTNVMKDSNDVHVIMKAMFKILKWLVSFLLVIAIVLIIIYFLPSATKEKVLTTLAGVVPESLQDKAEELILTPPEQRVRVIRELEDRLARLRTSESNQETTQLLQESEQLINELREHNNDASLQSVVTQRIVEQLLGETRPTPTPGACTN